MTEIAILLKNKAGTKYEGGIESAAKKPWYVPPPPPSVAVSGGELLTRCEIKIKGQTYNYQLHRDPNTYLVCEQGVVAPLSPDEFNLLQKKKNRKDRLEEFRRLPVSSYILYQHLLSL